MSETYSVLFKTSYKDTDFTREYEIQDVPEAQAAIPVVKNKVMAINASLAGGQASALANLFVSDDYDSQAQIGSLENIFDLRIKAVEEIEIPQTTISRNMATPEFFPEDFPDELYTDDEPKADEEPKEEVNK